MRTARLAGVWAGACALAACSSFAPIEAEHERRLAVEWATRLYELEPLAYHPVEEGQPLFVASTATPAGGLVVVPSKDRKVRGIEAATGRVVWEVATRGPNAARPVDLGPYGAPEELLVASFDGRVYRMNQRNGRILWTSEHPGTSGISASPVVSGKVGDKDAKVFVTSLDNRITALSLETGKKIWDHQRQQMTELTVSGQGGAAVVGGLVIAGFSDGALVAFSQEDGVTAWSADLAGEDKQFVDIDTTPVAARVKDGTIVVAGSFSRGLFAISAESGTVVWTKKGEGFLSAAADDGMIYAPQANGALWAIEAETGRVRWISRFDTGFCGTPVVSRKYVFAPVGEGLAVVDRGSGREVVRWSDGRGVRATPELAYGSLFVVGNGGLAYGLGVY